MRRVLPALFLLLAGCPAEEEKSGGADAELDCVAMCIYLCAQAPPESGLNVAECNEQCAAEADGIDACGACWAASGNLPEWERTALLLDCTCWEAPETVGCDDVQVDASECSRTCLPFTGLGG